MAVAHDTPNQRIAAAWRRHAPELLRYLRRRAGDPALAEDLVQETFLRLHRVEWPENVRAWLFQVARRLLIDHRRALRPHGPLPEDLAAAEPPAHERARAELGHCLPALLARLPAPYREALVLADLDGLPQQAIAAQQDLSLSGAKSRVQRARHLLRKTLDTCCIFERDHRGRITDFAPKAADSCVFSPPSSSSSADTNQKEHSAMKQVTIEWRHLDVDGATCDRCGDTGSELHQAIGALNRECAPRGVVFALRDTPLTAADLDQSNAILIDGRPIEQLLPDTTVGSSGCTSCGTLVGDDSAACRTLDQGDASYESVPAALIRDAACRAVDCCAAVQSGGCGCS